MFLRRWLALVVSVVLVLVIGCAKKDSRALATVTGSITHNGVPVDGATVTFHSTVSGGNEKFGPYSASTDSSGKYLLATFGKDPGIPPGLYKVTITKLDAKAATPCAQLKGEGVSK